MSQEPRLLTSRRYLQEELDEDLRFHKEFLESLSSNNTKTYENWAELQNQIKSIDVEINKRQLVLDRESAETKKILAFVQKNDEEIAKEIEAEQASIKSLEERDNYDVQLRPVHRRVVDYDKVKESLLKKLEFYKKRFEEVRVSQEKELLNLQEKFSKIMRANKRKEEKFNGIVENRARQLNYYKLNIAFQKGFKKPRSEPKAVITSQPWKIENIVSAKTEENMTQEICYLLIGLFLGMVIKYFY